jgi:CDP-glycerol glycerophosphotransferase (TagB/SpsB family)
LLTEQSPLKNLKAECHVAVRMIQQKKLMAALWRLTCLIVNHKSKNKVWLISDRLISATDNGYNFYHYAATQKLANKLNRIKPIFVISRKSQAYRELKSKKYPVCAFGSFRHKLLFLKASKVVAAYTDRGRIYIFAENQPYIAGLMKYDFVYLEHGVMMGDFSKAHGGFNKDARLFTMASSIEQKDVKKIKRYDYVHEEARLTGHPRLDALLNSKKPEKIVLIVPTWRSSLEGEKDPKHIDQWYYNEDFKNSDYFKFYNSLLKNKKLLAAVEENNYKLKFLIHPVFFAQYIDFKNSASDLVEVLKPPHDYINLFKTSAIMVTDYSGVHSDFGYQMKPVVYSQFDKKHVENGGHYHEKSNFSWEKHAFGPITKNVEETVYQIISYIHNGAKMQKKYQNKVEKFFPLRDGKSSKRIYEALLEIDNSKLNKEEK